MKTLKFIVIDAHYFAKDAPKLAQILDLLHSCVNNIYLHQVPALAEIPLKFFYTEFEYIANSRHNLMAI